MKKLLVACLVLFASSVADADFPKPPKEAATREELAKHFGDTIGFGHVEKWEFTTDGHELIAFWYCPYSGRAACYVHAYHHDRAKKTWILFVDRLLEPATGLSAEISADRYLVFKDREGKVVVREAIATLP